MINISVVLLGMEIENLRKLVLKRSMKLPSLFVTGAVVGSKGNYAERYAEETQMMDDIDAHLTVLMENTLKVLENVKKSYTETDETLAGLFAGNGSSS